MRILVVEDDELSAQMLRETLQADGHETEWAPDGAAAESMLESDGYRVVISDWEMPGVTGPELCRRVRAGGYDRYIYMILLTARRDKGSIIEGLEAGADDFLTKPFDPAELSVRLRGAERILALETRDLVLFGMAKLAESRDPETGTHLERVRSYCKVLAEEMSKDPKYAPVIDGEFIRLVWLTSPLHDIGKVGIPDAVLLKAGRLNDMEYNIMKTHTTMGASTLGAALEEYPQARFLRMACEIAACHHEQWNGAGYPNGFKEEEIPLCARIVALADVYDALRSKRVYKPAFAHHVARTIIIEGDGTHFDPAVVKAFIAREKEFETIADMQADDPGSVLFRAAA